MHGLLSQMGFGRDLDRLSVNETNRRYRGALAANAGLIIGVGIGRYSYTALVPMVVISGYLTPEQGGYTAAANLAGYVAGAIVAERAARQWQALIVLRAALLGTLCGLALSAMPWGFAWLTACRFSVGFTAGVIMAVGCSVVIQETTRAHLPSTTGIIFSGVGIGIVLSATIVSVLGGVSVALAWIALVAAGLLALPVAWSGWPIPRNVTNPDAGTDRKESTDPITTTPSRLRTQVLLHLAAYFLYGIALMPHTLFWVDFIVRDLGKGAAAGGANWALAGCGALVGAIASASLGGRIGFFWA